MHVDRYCMLCVLSSICAAMHKPVSTSMAVKIGDAACGVLLCCFGWLSDLPFACTHTRHQLLYSRCVSSCSGLSCAVGCCGVGRPFVYLASCCSSTSSVMYSSL